MIRFILAGVLLFMFLFPMHGARGQSPEAATLIDDFDQGYEGGSVVGRWWTYTDNSPEKTTFSAKIDQETFFNGIGSLRLDLDVAAKGYAGIGMDFGITPDWRDGEGIVFKLRADKAGLPVNIVLHLNDPTQTSAQSPGKTPFAALIHTPEGADQGWQEIMIPWSAFKRLTWMGTEGLTVFAANPIESLEIALEALGDERLTGTLWFDDIRVVSTKDLNAPPDYTTFFADLPMIRLSQYYRPDERKAFVAIVPVGDFQIIEVGSGEVVFKGKAVRWGPDADTDQTVYWGRFNSLRRAGTYKVVAEGAGESYPFTIGEDAYRDVTHLAARFFYWQRSGIALADPDHPTFQWEAGHTAPALLWDDPTQTMDVSGGWYDAGDYGRYIPTGAFAINQLLYAYAANPTAFADSTLTLPESGNGIPDLLDEVAWELNWLLKMQREDGAVHHKVTGRAFPNFGTLPAEDSDPLYVFGITSNDTAFFAAAMAQAAGIFRPIDPDAADRYLAAAERAWAWLAAHPNQVPEGGFQNPPESEYPMQGGYDYVGSEEATRLWAAAELFKTTGNPDYERAVATLFPQAAPQLTMTWANTFPQGLYAYLTAPKADPQQQAAVREAFLAGAGEIVEVARKTGYGVALNHSAAGFAYVWGSNQVALAHGLYLMLAYDIDPNEDYHHVAAAQMHYLLGKNPVSKFYLSGMGENSVLYPHHNVSYRFRLALPGVVTEGANRENAGGDAALMGLWSAGAPPALCYTDDFDSWASNEPTIDANATFVALAAYLSR